MTTPSPILQSTYVMNLIGSHATILSIVHYKAQARGRLNFCSIATKIRKAEMKVIKQWNSTPHFFVSLSLVFIKSYLIAEHCQSIGDHRQCCKTMIGNELRFNENQV